MQSIEDIPILMIGKGIVVANKPSGLLCQPGRGPELWDSLLSRLRRKWPSIELIHRLDRDTSGLILLATDQMVHREISILFMKREVLKRYVADVSGIPTKLKGRIDLPLLKVGNQPPRFGFNPSGKPCQTEWECLETHSTWSRLHLHPLTGRSHQLRAHMAEIGHPILGDAIYGDARTSIRLRLHASGLSFTHPLSGEFLELNSEPPF